MKYVKWLLTCAVAFVFAFGTYIGNASAASLNYQVEINKATNKLYLYQNGQVYKTYPVATGRTKDLTPEGTFTMVVKITNPGWKNIPGGVPENPLGARWMGISVNGDKGRTYGMHGTNNPSSIGTHASSGCIRMAHDNLLELYSLIPEGTPVWIHSGKSTNKWLGDPSFAVQPSKGQLKMKVDQGNVRTGPSTGSFIIEQVKAGTILEITGYVKDWYQVRLKSGKIGFVSNTIVTKVTEQKPTTTDNIKAASGTIIATEKLINVRSNPSTSASVIQKVAKGTKMKLTGEGTEWYRIQTSSGYTAYVHKSVAKKG